VVQRGVAIALVYLAIVLVPLILLLLMVVPLVEQTVRAKGAWEGPASAWRMR
jgi:hypothetical protein